MIAYPTNVRWLPYSARSASPWRRVPRGTVAAGCVGIGSAAAAWGLMHLALHLLR